jgi:hypothetical protein
LVEAQLEEPPILRVLFLLALRSYRQEKEDRGKAPKQKTS